MPLTSWRHSPPPRPAAGSSARSRRGCGDSIRSAQMPTSPTETIVRLLGGGQERTIRSTGGRYEFTGLTDGPYSVELQLPEGYTTYSPNRLAQIPNRARVRRGNLLPLACGTNHGKAGSKRRPPSISSSGRGHRSERADASHVRLGQRSSGHRQRRRLRGSESPARPLHCRRQPQRSSQPVQPVQPHSLSRPGLGSADPPRE